MARRFAYQSIPDVGPYGTGSNLAGPSSGYDTGPMSALFSQVIPSVNPTPPSVPTSPSNKPADPVRDAIVAEILRQSQEPGADTPITGYGAGGEFGANDASPGFDMGVPSDVAVPGYAPEDSPAPAPVNAPTDKADAPVAAPAPAPATDPALASLEADHAANLAAAKGDPEAIQAAQEQYDANVAAINGKAMSPIGVPSKGTVATPVAPPAPQYDTPDVEAQYGVVAPNVNVTDDVNDPGNTPSTAPSFGPVGTPAAQEGQEGAPAPGPPGFGNATAALGNPGDSALGFGPASNFGGVPGSLGFASATADPGAPGGTATGTIGAPGSAAPGIQGLAPGQVGVAAPAAAPAPAAPAAAPAPAAPGKGTTASPAQVAAQVAAVSDLANQLGKDQSQVAKGWSPSALAPPAPATPMSPPAQEKSDMEDQVNAAFGYTQKGDIEANNMLGIQAEVAQAMDAIAAQQAEDGISGFGEVGAPGQGFADGWGGDAVGFGGTMGGGAIGGGIGFGGLGNGPGAGGTGSVAAGPEGGTGSVGVGAPGSGTADGWGGGTAGVGNLGGTAGLGGSLGANAGDNASTGGTFGGSNSDGISGGPGDSTGDSAGPGGGGSSEGGGTGGLGEGMGGGTGDGDGGGGNAGGGF